MPRRVFFCFHYQDVADWRVQVVRNRWLSCAEHEDAGLFDEPTWDESTLSGQAAIKRLIDSGLEHTCATCVLIGTHTWSRRWVRYEIIESVQRGNRIVGVHINGIPDRSGKTRPPGSSPLEHLALAIAPDGSALEILQHSNRVWQRSAEHPGWSLSKRPPAHRCGKRLQLSTLYPVHDWVADNGPENLDGWLGG